MNAKGGSHKSRSGRAGGASNPGSNIEKGGPSTSLSASASATTAGPGDKKESASASTESNDFTVIHAILQNTNNPRLDSVQRLLKSVVSAAATVVRGTDSQRRFTTTYTEFCRSAMRCMADVEEAVFEQANPGRRASDAAEDEIVGIADDYFLKQVAAYVSTHTNSLGLAYLEHVALAALEKQQQQRKRERAGVTQRPSKASRTATASGGSTSAAGSSNSTYSGSTSKSGIGSGSRAMLSGAGAGTSSASAAFDTLGLIDAQDTMREALHIIEQERLATAAGTSAGSDGAHTKRRAAQAATAALGGSHPSSRPSGVFVSKGSVNQTGGDQLVYDLRNPQLKLSTVPELVPRLQPWTIPPPSSGVFLERVTMERDRKGGGGATATAAAPTATAATSASVSTLPHHGGQSTEGPRTTLDVCLAATPMELLRQYEAHEAALAAEPQPWLAPSTTVASAGPYSVVPYAGKCAGGSSRPTATPQAAFSPSSPPSGEARSAAPPLSEGEAVNGGPAEAEADALTASAFFPAVRANKMLACLPPFVISNVSHFGVSRMEFVYTMTPTQK